jgi:hypothetical protein
MIVQKQLVRRGTDWILLQHPGQKNPPIVKNLWNKFWTVKILYSDYIHVFFKRASCGFVYLTDPDLSRHTLIVSQKSHYRFHIALTQYNCYFFIISFHYITYVMNNANNSLITDHISRGNSCFLIFRSKYTLQPSVLKYLSTHSCSSLRMTARFTPIRQRTKYSY